ncbi:hypothetical protein BRAO375_3660030 [Bradyrhizobium sp. ORS 375]|uniref:hypothetical protein n=1 Tax=Bradyrhizobium sp. (strain ORS 375) TaxID=566679 RepID=UPI000240640B|nr:hypothetical protein [Bradyrhizobium sp. ORS 375]CCD94636.1 hypothetical protein BRAO375_3660030 [Bradyrhizobium sp. ORS 375]
MGNFHKKLRRNESFKKLSDYLNQHGYPFEPFQAGKHPYLVVQLGEGKSVKFFFPSSASDCRSADNCVSQIKRAIRQRLASNDNARV